MRRENTPTHTHPKKTKKKKCRRRCRSSLRAPKYYIHFATREKENSQSLDVLMHTAQKLLSHLSCTNCEEQSKQTNISGEEEPELPTRKISVKFRKTKTFQMLFSHATTCHCPVYSAVSSVSSCTNGN